MNIAITIDTKPFEAITRKREKRILFSVVAAINATAKRVQQAEHDRVRSQFIVRKPAFFFGSAGRPGGVAAKLGPSPDIASGRLYREIFVGEAGSKAGPLLLAEFEKGGTRKPFVGKKVAVPITGGPARPTPQSSVPKAYTFAGLKFRKFKRGTLQRRKRRGKTVNESVFGEFGRLSRVAGAAAESGVQWKGEQSTYLIPGVGVFQRTGEGSRPVWAFLPPFPIDKRLEFVSTAERVAPPWFREELERETVEALTRVR